MSTYKPVLELNHICPCFDLSICDTNIISSNLYELKRDKNMLAVYSIRIANDNDKRDANWF